MGLSVVSAGITLYRYFHLEILHSYHKRGRFFRVVVVAVCLVGYGSCDGCLAPTLNAYLARRGVYRSHISVRRLVTYCAIACVSQLNGESCVVQALHHFLSLECDGGRSLFDGEGCCSSVLVNPATSYSNCSRSCVGIVAIIYRIIGSVQLRSTQFNTRYAGLFLCSVVSVARLGESNAGIGNVDNG